MRINVSIARAILRIRARVAPCVLHFSAFIGYGITVTEHETVSVSIIYHPIIPDGSTVSVCTCHFLCRMVSYFLPVKQEM